MQSWALLLFFDRRKEKLFRNFEILVSGHNEYDFAKSTYCGVGVKKRRSGCEVKVELAHQRTSITSVVHRSFLSWDILQYLETIFSQNWCDGKDELFEKIGGVNFSIGWINLREVKRKKEGCLIYRGDFSKNLKRF